MYVDCETIKLIYLKVYLTKKLNALIARSFHLDSFAIFGLEDSSFTSPNENCAGITRILNKTKPSTFVLMATSVCTMLYKEYNSMYESVLTDTVATMKSLGTVTSNLIKSMVGFRYYSNFVLRITS